MKKNVRFDSGLVKGDSVDNNKLKKKEKLLFDTNNSVKATNSDNLEQIADNIWNDVNETNWVGLPTTGDNLETHLGLISSDKSIEIYNIYKEKHGETIFSSIITEYVLTFNVICAKDGPDGETIAGGGHALSVLKITSGEVYVANPWHPDEIEIIPRQDFIDMSKGFTAAKM